MRYIDLDSLPWYSKRQVAEHQLDRAIRLLLDDHDAISAITLAGAAEEILGKLVEVGGEKSSLGSFIDDCLMIGRVSHGEEWKPNAFADMANHTRNSLKHIVDASDVCVTEEDACEMIDRAVQNLWKLGGNESEQVRRYDAWRQAR